MFASVSKGIENDAQILVTDSLQWFGYPPRGKMFLSFGNVCESLGERLDRMNENE